ncbi:unnamed protein product [Adineta steineri]|uniref:TLDc domain-containing protein n=1 Tax=Adineta steineri TaxID=433720 RepID=A0A814MLP5_9BILA|nr:unnamed protein product [Adineta steineri]CAF1081094.1 unnamed protein product [Adineta steineri]
MSTTTSVGGKVLLDVGGKKFSTTIQTLTSHEEDSYFTALFSRHWELEKDERGRIFIDRNGDLFVEILEYMRNAQNYDIPSDEHLQHKLLNEAAFFQLHKLSARLYLFKDTSLLNVEHQRILNKFYGKKHQHWQLMYKATRDGFDTAAFHKLCANRNRLTMTVIQSTDGYLFGGIDARNFEDTSDSEDTSDCEDTSDYDRISPFLFLLVNANRNHPTKFLPIKKIVPYYVNKYGLSFGKADEYDLRISDRSNENMNSYCNLGRNYSDTIGLGKNTFTGSHHFQTKEIEVFTLASRPIISIQNVAITHWPKSSLKTTED